MAKYQRDLDAVAHFRAPAAIIQQAADRARARGQTLSEFFRAAVHRELGAAVPAAADRKRNKV